MLNSFVSHPKVPSFYDGYSVGNFLSTTNWQEISGGAWSTLPTNSGYFWIVSDSPANMLAAVSGSNAGNAGVWTLSGVSISSPSDWEDIATARVSGQSYIYVADFGDNPNTRTSFNIHRVKEPIINGSSGGISTGNIETIVCDFPAGSLPTHKDAECLLVDPSLGDMYVITKRESIPGVFKLPHSGSYAGTNTLSYMGKMYDIPDTTTIPLGATACNVVAGCISPDGKEILIKNYDSIFHFSRPDLSVPIYNTLTGTPTTISYVGGGSNSATYLKRSHPSAEPQGETLFFDYEGQNYYTASEYLSTDGSTSTRYPLFKYSRVSKMQSTGIFQDGLYPTAAYTGTLDTYIWDTNPNTSYGTASSMVVDTAVGIETDQRKSLLYFDISSIPTGSVVTSAQLDLWINTEGQGYKFHKMLTGWSESSTYNSLNGGIDNDGTDAAVASDCINGLNWDTLTGMTRNNMAIDTVQSWVSNPSNNKGWMIEQITNTVGDGVQFDTREGTTTGRRPKLTVKYV